ncbi:MAG TPA: serine hydrolase domain-containing protein [Agromyces mariniharenae]|nr:serine hydrolase domain-containing protein [Agromyces mariniharenae]
MRSRRPVTPRTLPVLVAVGCLALSACVGTSQPAPDAQATDATGDAELLRLIRPSFLAETDRVAIAVIDGDEVRRAFLDADETTVFEIGSITKVFTGELLAEAVERGEVELDDELGDQLDLGDAPAASVTLRDLAAHRSGLPIFPTDPEWVEHAQADVDAGGDGVDETVDELLELTRTVELQSGHEFGYSNLGAALVGQALAEAAGTDYATLLSERLLEPLGLDGASLPIDDGDVDPQHAGGFGVDGSPAEPSSLGAFAPAGGIHATVDDLVAFASAVIDGPLTDSAAQTDTVEGGGGGAQIGYFWSVDDDRGHVILSHNGMTGGFTSIMVIDRTAGTAAIVLANRSESVDDVGYDLLAQLG